MSVLHVLVWESKSTRLTNLDFFSNQISDDGATSLAEAIKVNETLTNLDFSRNQISDAGAISRAKAIKLNKTDQVGFVSQSE